MSLTQHLIEKFDAEAEKIWPGLTKWTGTFREERASRYERLKNAVRYLRSR